MCAAVRRLDEESLRLERFAGGPSVEALIAEERAHSHEFAGAQRLRVGTLAFGATEKRVGRESRLRRYVNSANR
jgi:uncharacterized protein